MRKASVYLTDADQERLEYLARREGKSQAAILREAFRMYEARLGGFTYSALEGCVASDGMSAADIPEEELLLGFGEDSLPHRQG